MFYSSNNTLSNNYALNNANGIFLDSSSNNTIFNNYFNNTNNAFDNGNNIWNIPKTSETNIINGAFLGGNFWSDYAGNDADGDGLGDTMLPYTSSAGITNGGDYLPLLCVISPSPRAPNITSFSPSTSTVTNNVSESRTFSITTNQTVNVSWLINGTENVTMVTPASIRGDINRNNRLDTGDATLILRYIVGLSIPSQYQPVLPIGDMNCNNRIDTGDATLVLRDLVGLSIPRCWE